MAKGPAVVIIARHGARLDAADKTWHLTSPTPYDPPLTYGGWTQAQALGLRIASLLHAREQSSEKHIRTNNESPERAESAGLPRDANKPAADSLSRGRRKHKIVIHSSPYLRCIQTSVAIAAGLAQFQPDPAQPTQTAQLGKNNTIVPRASQLSRAVSTDSIHGLSITTSNLPLDRNLEAAKNASHSPPKILLRIDAFLGEWLSPDYFEDITPPPNSTMMVVGAKADLLRRGDHIEGLDNQSNNKGNFPGGWKSPSASNSPRVRGENGALKGRGALAQVLPFRERSSSQGSVPTLSSRTSQTGTYSSSLGFSGPRNSYNPPIPSYAISPLEPIPRGYVAHARDACSTVDYQWDSMREPQNWGDGGEYGDEWSTMHKRFRRGLVGLLSWYKEHDVESHQDKNADITSAKVEKEEADEDEELVIVLVTHGAGCNALLGAISNQPVLMDVNMASLSMAVRRDHSSKKTSSPSPSRSPSRSTTDLGISDEYEMSILASVDHLRPGVDPSMAPQPSTPNVLASPSVEHRRRLGVPSDPTTPVDSPFAPGEPYRGSYNSSLGSIRTNTASSTSSRLASGSEGPTASSAQGLWSAKPPADTGDVDGSDDQNAQGKSATLNSSRTEPEKSGLRDRVENTEGDQLPPLPEGLGRPLSQYGLWGSPGAASNRPAVPKRRWTVNEREK